jgi:hypothetical protein
MRQHWRWFAFILVTGFLVRLALAAFAPHPGISDPNHYFNLARNLAAGRGFVIDYIWQYHRPPEAVTHPEDYWMPLPAVWPAIGMTLLGNSLLAALIPSVILGSLLPALAYAIASVAHMERPVRLMAMASVVFLPELVLNSARTDTTISYVLFIGLATLCFYVGMRLRPPLLLLAGVFGGLGQLSRQDGALLAPAMAVAVLIFWRVGRYPIPWRWLIALPAAWIVTLLPWLWRNYTLFGELLPSGAGHTLFMTSFNDQFTYGRELNLEHYLAWGWQNILGNIAFQTLANVKTLYTVLDITLPITVLLGLGRMITQRDRDRLALLLTPLLFVLALFVFYSFITPFHTMGGSFKKSYMSIIPYLGVASAWGIASFIQPRQVAYTVAALSAVFMLLNAIELTRADFRQADQYNRSIVSLSAALHDLGDRNGDDRITVMTQDPFLLNYHGFPALMIPSDDRDMILEAAYRYQVDYIILPAARPALDPLYDGLERDPRLPMAGRSGRYQMLAVIPPGE